jgi:MFS family permease
MSLPNLKGVIMLSLAFFFLFFSYMGTALIITKVLLANGFDNLGFYSLAIVCFSYALFGLFVSPYIAKIGTKKGLMFGSIFFPIFLFSFSLVFFADKSEDAVFYKKPMFI